MPSIIRLTLPNRVFKQLNAGVSQLPLPPPLTCACCPQPASRTPRKHANPSEFSSVPVCECCLAQAYSARLRKPATKLSLSHSERRSALTCAAASFPGHYSVLSDTALADVAGLSNTSGPQVGRRLRPLML